MRKIFYELEIGFAGCGDEGVMEVDDNATDAEIQTMVDDMAIEHATSWEGDERLGFDPEQSEEEMADEVEQFYQNCYGTWRAATDEDY